MRVSRYRAQGIQLSESVTSDQIFDIILKMSCPTPTGNIIKINKAPASKDNTRSSEKNTTPWNNRPEYRFMDPDLAMFEEYYKKLPHCGYTGIKLSL